MFESTSKCVQILLKDLPKLKLAVSWKRVPSNFMQRVQYSFDGKWRGERFEPTTYWTIGHNNLTNWATENDLPASHSELLMPHTTFIIYQVSQPFTLSEQ